MDKLVFTNTMRANGDSYINYLSVVSRKVKYHVATMDFRKEISPYIAARFLKFSNKMKLKDNQVLVFCYDLNEFKPIDVSSVVSLIPLNTVIKNG